VRTRGDKGYLTIKGPSMDGISRFEWEKEITLQDARELFTLCQKGRIEKTRYLVHNGKHTIEVDEFHGDNEGLVFAEIELADVNEQFLRPAFLGAEVTGNPRYYNAYISKHPYPTWEKE
jgi:adenylate cyclase